MWVKSNDNLNDNLLLLHWDESFKKYFTIGYISYFDKVISNDNKRHKYIGYVFSKKSTLAREGLSEFKTYLRESPTIIFENDIDVAKLKLQVIAKEKGWDIQDLE